MSPIEALRQNFLSPQRHEPQWREGLTNEQYHALKAYVSSSSLRKFPKSGKSFFWAYNSKEAQTDPKELGEIFHYASLEPEVFAAKKIEEPKFPGHGNSKVHKDAKKAWLDSVPDDGSIIVRQKFLDTMKWMSDSLMSHPDAVAILKHGVAERSGFYFDPDTGIPCRIRPDKDNDRLSVIADLKTTAKDISWKSYQRTIWKERFDISLAMYAEGTQIITGKPVSDTAIIVVQTVKPYECAVYPLSRRTLDVGKMDYHWSLRELAEALKTNRWSQAQKRMEEIEHPSHVFKELSI